MLVRIANREDPDQTASSENVIMPCMKIVKTTSKLHILSTFMN